MAAQATPFSLWNDLTAIRDNYAATEFIKYLVQTIGYYASSATRNAQTSYRLVTRCRDICNEINKLIESVEKSDDNWKDFETYTAWIHPLEVELLKIAHDTVFLDDSIELKAINDFITSVDSWKTKRRALRNFLEKLHPSSDSELLKALPAPDKWLDDLNSARRQDDLALFRDTYDFMTTHPFRTDKRLEQHISKVITHFTKIRSSLKAPASNDDDAVVLSVRCAIVMLGVMEVSISKDPVSQRIKKQEVWTKAAGPLNKLSDYISKGAPNDYRTSWDAFENWLKETAGIEVLLPNTYNALTPFAAKIRRAYHSRGIALISGCRTMADDCKKNNNRSIDMVSEAVTVTTKALTEATNAMPSLSVYGEDSKEALDAISSAEAKINDYFSEYNMEDAKKKFTADMTTAAKQDKDHMTELNSRLNGKYPNGDPIGAGRAISLKVRRSVKEPQLNATLTTYDLSETTTLTAILWKECNGVTAKLKPSRFYKSDKNAKGDWPGFIPLQLHKQLKDIGTTDVFLVIDDEKI